ncbi:hypothetical protein LTR62_004375 [Meristemomyces frigidus]|uniref:protein O-GlcNAc transferase n=1 Tax=Meristemomyces frigidus TaxID=1508187 RepID=A0AAN7TDZ0_9PEZI|nr:hypothetical protein LTR62_004375 [Meristemomyces frigidus]
MNAGGLRSGSRTFSPDWPRSTSMPRPPQQYALPLHHGFESRDNHYSGVNNVQWPRLEDTLRRKTPNGTLNAGYDGTIEYANPQKHQLLVDESNHLPRTYNDIGPSGKRTFVQHQQQHQHPHQQQQQQQQPEYVYSGNGPSFGSSWYGPHYSSTHHLPVMDSMLNQTGMSQIHTQPLYYTQTVPSVLEPSMQYLGPTASGVQGSGPYGPYWHDGTFVPYRAAAIRDPRFYHQAHMQWSGPLPLPHSSYSAQAWQQPQHSKVWSSNSAYLASNHGPQSTPHASQFPSASNPPAASPAWPATSAPLINPVASYEPASSNAQHRDATFIWALQQYRNLLASIHYNRSQQQIGRPVPGGPQHRPAFYPRPPRPSSGTVRPAKRRTVSAGHNLQATRDVERADIDDVSHTQSSTSTPRQRSPSAWNSTDVQLRDNEYDRPGLGGQRPSSDHSYTWPRAPQAQEERYGTLRRTSGANVLPYIAQLPGDDPARSRAFAALDIMTKICQDGDWEWTDGMLLGGCLAYGLGSYQQAHRWYSKVLEQDAKHLEAMSNLAATLLALGIRNEAEQYWTRVVKAAPNLFEAVEHLVGLLCHAQRSTHAIKVIEYVEASLRQAEEAETPLLLPRRGESTSSTASRSPCVSDFSEQMAFDFETDDDAFNWRDNPASAEPGFGSSGFAVAGSENGRILALIHAKGNMLYGLGENAKAARAFEDAVLIAAGRSYRSIHGLVNHILAVVSRNTTRYETKSARVEPILLAPEQALATARLCFPDFGELPGLQHVLGGPQSLARKTVISTTSNALLSLAKIFQDGMSSGNRSAGIGASSYGVRDILGLYYLSLSLQPSPSTANNVGILLASVQQAVQPPSGPLKSDIPGVLPGSGIALALQYYNYGLQLDQHHAHLYTNLGSLLKDINQLDAAINMYERAVKCDGKFDIALANLANAVKDKGRIGDAIVYYKRAVEVSPDFAEAVCGLVNALNSVCAWQARGGIAESGGRRDRWHVDEKGMLLDAKLPGASSSGWIKRVIDIVEKQLADGESWGCGMLTPPIVEAMLLQTVTLDGPPEDVEQRSLSTRKILQEWSGQRWEGARVTRLVERATRRIGWHWYQDAYVKQKQRSAASYTRPQLPASLTVPAAPTVLPFHTFTCPMSAKQIRLISQRNGLRISVSALRAPWLPKQVYPPPKPPAPCLNVGYVSSDFNNHPLAHLMQSVFGLHDIGRVKAYCYATTASDKSEHRAKIEREAPAFYDASTWSVERLVNQVVKDGIHILVNLNGYTRGARNEVFAARPAPIQMSFMGFAGTLGAEWCDYLLADETAIPPDTLRPWRRNVDLEDVMTDGQTGDENEEWVYGENIIYCRDTFFCCDHKQSAPDAQSKVLSWEEEQKERWRMRKELFPQASDNTVIFGNFNQLYKVGDVSSLATASMLTSQQIDPTTFRTWLRILAHVPNSILWLLRFPDLGESHLLSTAKLWGGPEVAQRVIFTDVAPKRLHISRARICDVVLDTAECNAHTTAADVLWSGTPLLTLPRYQYKMCSRMAASILKGALPKTEEGARAAADLIATDEDDYEAKAVKLGQSLSYGRGCEGKGTGRLMELRKLLYHARWSSALFDTKRWVRDLEDAYGVAWTRYVKGEGGDIWLDKVARVT